MQFHSQRLLLRQSVGSRPIHFTSSYAPGKRINRVVTPGRLREGTRTSRVESGELNDVETDLFKRALSGKSFMCTQCGKCCTGSGEVWISEMEGQRIARYLNMPLKQFYQTYTKNYDKYEGWRLLAVKAENQDCIFLKDKICSIHPVRPSQCSTYPWWPDLMEPRAWEAEKNDICEGFDHPEAPPLDMEEAAQQLRASLRENQVRLMSNKRLTKGGAAKKKSSKWAGGSGDALQDSGLHPDASPVDGRVG